MLAIKPLVIALKLAYRELHEWRGEAVRCAAAFCIARFLARCLSPDHSLLRSVYFFRTGHVPAPNSRRVSR